MGGDGRGSMEGSGKDDGGDEGDGVSYDGSVSRRLMSSLPSLSSSALHRRFLVCLAGGEMGVGDSDEAWALAVASMTGN
jgi:hypothetical protein